MDQRGAQLVSEENTQGRIEAVALVGLVYQHESAGAFLLNS